MKVIGTTENKEFLVSATGDELARLTGFDSQWCREHSNKPKVGVGDVIDVNALFVHAEHMRRAAAEIVRAKGILDTVSGGLVLADNLIRKITEPPQPPAEKAE